MYIMHQVENRLNEEYERTVHCLALSSEPKIRAIVEKQLITNNLHTVIEVKDAKKKKNSKRKKRL